MPLKNTSSSSNNERSERGVARMTMQELFARIEDTANCMRTEFEARDKRLDGHDDKLSDHEDRISRLEGAKPMTGKDASKDASNDVSSVEPTSGSTKFAPSPDDIPAPNNIKPEKEREVKPNNSNGIGYGYRYWNGHERTWGLTQDIWKAKQISNGVYTPVWVWYEGGQIDHICSPEEVTKYAP